MNAIRQTIQLQVNGADTEVRASLHDSLLSVLRDQLQLTGAKRGCNQGVCGACTVVRDGWPVRACLSLAHGCAHAEIQTLEGLNQQAAMQILQKAFSDAGAFQCGFCTPGMLVTAHALLLRNLSPDADQVRAALSGNLCRCTGYAPIVAAVLQAAEQLRAQEPAP
jgi:aerobic-type carbon monoxide dehydrogenase small subunit (CoxS/CutS family)